MDDRETEDSAGSKNYNESANSAAQTALLLFAVLAIVRSYTAILSVAIDTSVLDSLHKQSLEYKVKVIDRLEIGIEIGRYG